MTNYAKYLKEREDFDIVENDLGFASYKCLPKECYIRDLYVVPEARKSNEASRLADRIVEIAKSKGIKILTGSVSTLDKNKQVNIQVLTKYGFKQFKQIGELIWFVKEI